MSSYVQSHIMGFLVVPMPAVRLIVTIRSENF